MPVRTLNTLLPDLNLSGQNVFLKLDVQGYEKFVLRGASEILSSLVGIQLEMSIVQMYDDEMLYLDILNFMKQHGFEVHSLEPGHTHYPTGRMKQFDGVFFREDAIADS